MFWLFSSQYLIDTDYRGVLRYTLHNDKLLYHNDDSARIVKRTVVYSKIVSLETTRTGSKKKA